MAPRRRACHHVHRLTAYTPTSAITRHHRWRTRAETSRHFRAGCADVDRHSHEPDHQQSFADIEQRCVCVSCRRVSPKEVTNVRCWKAVEPQSAAMANRGECDPAPPSKKSINNCTCDRRKSSGMDAAGCSVARDAAEKGRREGASASRPPEVGRGISGEVRGGRLFDQ